MTCGCGHSLTGTTTSAPIITGGDNTTSSGTTTDSTGVAYTPTIHFVPTVQGGAKAEDAHVHEVAFPDGSSTLTGPPQGAAGTTPAPPEATPPEGYLRAPRRDAKSGVASSEPEDLAKVKAAIAVTNADLLPPLGATIWKRMVETGLRFFGEEPRHRSYVERVAWRAVRQNYGLEAPSPEAVEAPNQPSAGVQTHQLTGQRLQVGKRQAKYLLVGGTSPRPSGGGFVVPVATNADLEGLVLRGGVAREFQDYDRIDSIPVPDNPGASVRVGYTQNHANILDIFVPRSIVVSDESGAGAVNWVRDNWRLIFGVAKGTWAASAKRVQGTRFVKFVITPEKAAERIGYGAAYVPWEVDLQGQYATAETVRKMAHRFMENHGDPKDMHAVAKMQDGARPFEIVESFVARDNDPHFLPGTWVIGAKFHPTVWQDIVAGRRRGFSIGGRWGRHALADLVLEAA